MSAERKPFQPSRADGRSDRQVVYGLMQTAGPGVVFDYERITAALQVGVAEPITRARATAAVRAANRSLLTHQQRSVAVVRNRGYRIIEASEHAPAAAGRRQKAERQIRTGISLLKSCRLDELSETQRTLHEGQLLVLSGVYEAVRHVHARQDRQQQIIDGITKRLDRLEGPHG